MQHESYNVQQAAATRVDIAPWMCRPATALNITLTAAPSGCDSACRRWASAATASSLCATRTGLCCSRAGKGPCCLAGEPHCFVCDVPCSGAAAVGPASVTPKSLTTAGRAAACCWIPGRSAAAAAWGVLAVAICGSRTSCSSDSSARRLLSPVESTPQRCSSASAVARSAEYDACSVASGRKQQPSKQTNHALHL